MAIKIASSIHAVAGLAPGMRAAIYVRISRDPSGAALGVKRQERECRELCARLGLTVVAVFEDDDRSAFSGKLRPRYQAMLERLELSDFQVIVAWHPDRLHRSPVELETFIDLLERTRTTVVTVQGGDYDLSTAAGRMTARVVGAVARHESEHKSERLRAKMRELTEAGKLRSGGGTRGYGYDQYVTGTHQLTVRPGEADVIRDVVDRFLAGESRSALVKDLNERGVPTVSGKPWSFTTINHILTSPRVAGLREHDGRLAAAPWPAIIEPDTFYRVRARLQANAKAERRAVRRYPLAGIVFCGRQGCGKALHGKTHERGSVHYICPKDRGGCGRLSVVAVPVEERVADALFDIVEAQDFKRRLDRSDGRPSDVHDETESIERQMAELAGMWSAKQITRAEWLAARAPLQEQLDTLQRKISESTPYSPLDPWKDGDRSMRDDWERLSIDQKRAILGAVFRRVVIAPGDPNAARRFDSRRVTVERRF